MIVCETADVDATLAIAARIADLSRPGDLLVLVGDLGAGKTAFTQGFARRVGVEAPVTSPTFTLANRYVGRMVVNHLDAYRVDDIAEARDLAIPELLDDGVTLIEWGDVILPALPADRLEVRLTFGAADDDRRIEIVTIGPAWARRGPALAASLDDWTA